MFSMPIPFPRIFSPLTSAASPLGAARALALALLLAALAAPDAAAAAERSRFFIQEFRVEGVRSVASEEIEETVYPFLGPERDADDVELARLAVEALYRSKGYQAAFVQVPEQDAADGVIRIVVTEGVVGRVSVRGSRYSSPVGLKQDAPSLAEGQPLDFTQIARDVARLNQVADRRVTPEFKAGAEPGRIDVDLRVEEAKPPLHANVELNNRNSANTSALRLNGGVSYGNLFQRGHTLGLNFQVAPENLDDAKVFSGYYLLRPAGSDFLTLQLLATKQASDVSTLGGGAVSGRGDTIGGRAIFALPGGDAFFQTISAGIDFKHLEQDLTAGSSVSSAPIDYAVLALSYGATWLARSGSTTELSLSPSLGLRGFGGDEREFDTRRFGASGSFAHLRGELARTQKLPSSFELYVRGQFQLSSQPLVDSEQFSGGGIDTVRGYYESEVSGDDGAVGTAELRSPSLLAPLGVSSWGEWRVHAFVDAGHLSIQQPLPGQAHRFDLLGVGFGTRVQLRKNFTGSIDAGWPLLEAGQTEVGDLRVNFSVGATY